MNRKPTNGALVIASARWARTRGKAIRAMLGTRSESSQTETSFSTSLNSRSAGDRRTFRLDPSAGGDSAPTGASSNSGDSGPNPLEAHSGLTKYRRHSVSVSVGHGKPLGLGDTNYRKLGTNRSGYPDYSGFCHQEPEKENRICPGQFIWRSPGRTGGRVLPVG